MLNNKIKNYWANFIKSLIKHRTLIATICVMVMAVCAVITLVCTVRGCCKNNIGETKAVFENPILGIKSPYIKIKPYGRGDDKSVALEFHVPIRNDGDATAYNIDIKNKELKLVEKTLNLSDTSLRTKFTSSPFNIKPGDTVEDTIFVDESPLHMQLIYSGAREFVLKYKMQFSDKRKKSAPYIYEYEAKMTGNPLKATILKDSQSQIIK